jgi:SagB-type dehydrogenase family enzyme
MPSFTLWKERELWALREDVRVDMEPNGGPARLHGHWGDYTIPSPSLLARDVLFRMSLGPVSLQNAVKGKAAHPGTQIDELAAILEQLQPLILRSIGTASGQPLLTVMPLTVRSKFQPLPLDPGRPVRLSRFAGLRTNGNALCIESPFALHRILLHRPEASALVTELARPVTPAALLRARAGAESVTAGMLEYLVATGVVVQADGGTSAGGKAEEARFAEDHDPAVADWSPVDMMFHTRSTLGRHDHSFGLTRPQRETTPPEPVVAPQSADSIELSRPRWEDLLEADPPLTVAIEGRHSTRRDAGTVRLAELATLLYRVARVRSQVALGDPDPAGCPRYELSDRPYPSGGACYELEFYVTATDCAGLAPGTYHYDPQGHRLEPVHGEQGAVEELLACARAAAALDSRPPVLISITARFRRLSWKYPGLAYRLVLMHVGVVIQNLYLVCTAMRLAPCAVGSVSIEAAARGLGTDWRTQPCVGQFIVSGRPADGDEQGHSEWRDVNDAQWATLAKAILHHRSQTDLKTNGKAETE